VCLLCIHSSHANAFHHSLLMMVAFEVLTEFLSIQHLVAHKCYIGGISTNLYLSVPTMTLLSWRLGSFHDL